MVAEELVLNDAGKLVCIEYTNYRNETGLRTILPERIWYGSTPWHKESQWLLDAIDIEKGERRSFAIADISSWSTVNKPEAPHGSK